MVFTTEGAFNYCSFRWNHWLVRWTYQRGTDHLAARVFICSAVPGRPGGPQVGTVSLAFPAPCAKPPQQVLRAGLSGFAGRDIEEGRSCVLAGRSSRLNHTVLMSSPECGLLPSEFEGSHGGSGVFLIPAAFLPSCISACRRGLGFLDS